MTRLTQVRRARGWSQNKLAMVSGVEQCRISAFETMRADINNARIETVAMLAKALNVKIYDILNDDLGEMLRGVAQYEEQEHDDWFDGTRFAEMRKRMKMSQVDFSSDIMMTQSQVSKYERLGVECVRIETLCRLCISLACSPCDLIDDKIIRDLLRGVL